MSDGKPGRRAVLAAVGAATLGGFAGCASVLDAEAEGWGGTDDATDGPAGNDGSDTAFESGTYGLAAVYSTDDGVERELVVRPEDFDAISEVLERGSDESATVQATLTESGAERFTERLRSAGFLADEGVDNCRWAEDPTDPGYCLVTVIDGEASFAAGVTAGFADQVDSGAFVDEPEMLIQIESVPEAESFKEGIEERME